VSISDIPFTVVGILPESFESVFSPLNYAPAEIWSPLRYDASLTYACRTCRHLHAFGRIRDGVSFEKARAEMDGISTTLWKEHPSDYGAPGIVMTPLADRVTAALRPVLWALLGAVAFVLLIACANVASLLLAQAASRRREIAIRTALGAGRERIARMLLTEALLLRLIGGKAFRLTAIGLSGGLVAAWALGRVLRTLLFEVGPTDALALATGALVVLAVSFGASLLPTRRATRIDPLVCLREE
jgi:hypothetical protein